MKTSRWVKLLLSIQGSWKPIPSSIAAGFFPDLSCTWDITAVSAHISAAGTGAARLDWVFVKLELEVISKHSGNSTTLPALSYCARAAGDAQVVQLWDASLSLPCSVCDTDMPQGFWKCSSHHNSPWCLHLRKLSECWIRAQQSPGKHWIWLSLAHTSGAVVSLTDDCLQDSAFHYFPSKKQSQKSSLFVHILPNNSWHSFLWLTDFSLQHGFHPHKTLEVKRRKCKEGNSTLLHLIQ